MAVYTCNYYSVLVLNLAIRVHLCGIFPLITFVANIMYLQIIYQCEALQMPKIIKQKVLQLVCKQMRYGFTTNLPYISSG